MCFTPNRVCFLKSFTSISTQFRSDKIERLVDKICHKCSTPVEKHDRHLTLRTKNSSFINIGDPIIVLQQLWLQLITVNLFLFFLSCLVWNTYYWINCAWCIAPAVSVQYNDLCSLAPIHCPAAQPILYWCSRNMSFWSSISFNLAVLMNLLVAFFYPLEGVRGGQSLKSSSS